MVRIDQLDLVSFARVHEVRKRWFTIRHDAPSMGLRELIIKDDQVVGVYSTFQGAGQSIEEARRVEEKELREAGDYLDRLRIAMTHGIPPCGPEEWDYDLAYSEILVNTRELREGDGRTFWIRPSYVLPTAIRGTDSIIFPGKYPASEVETL